MLQSVISVAIGGALGSVARYGVGAASFKIFGAGFPYGTMLVNILGSFLMGLLVAVFAHVWQPSEALKLFLVSGFLGGFTTFSAFSLDLVTLWERQETLQAAFYLGGSVLLSIAALFAAMGLVRGMFV